jgi:hypothetical protein
MGKGEGEVVIFAGGSAGARGAMTFSHRVAGMLPPGTPFFLFLDSPLWIDVEALHPEVFGGFPAETRSLYELADASGVVSDACRLLNKVLMPLVVPGHHVGGGGEGCGRANHDHDVDSGVLVQVLIGGKALAPYAQR